MYVKTVFLYRIMNAFNPHAHTKVGARDMFESLVYGTFREDCFDSDVRDYWILLTVTSGRGRKTGGTI